MLESSVMDGAQKAGLLMRVVARGIDLIIVLAISEALPRAGFIAGVSYVLIGDGLFGGGRSAGKKLLGLNVMDKEGLPCGVKDSILRNTTLAVGVLLCKVPLIGWLLTAAVFALEFIVLLGSRDARRIGDELAGTTVYETTRFKEAV